MSDSPQSMSGPDFKRDTNVELYSLEAYFEMEFDSDKKHEFWNGDIRAMAYASPAHGEIQTNLLDALSQCLKEIGCKRYAPDRMVYVPECNKVFYPDLVVVCEEQQFYDYKNKMQATLNPTLIVEILSESTAQNDRTDKWSCYRNIASLQQYVLVEQAEVNIHSYRRQSDRNWQYSYADDKEESIEVLECLIALSDVYAGLEV